MMDNRRPLGPGSHLPLGGTKYTIARVLGSGANAFVYLASYDDNLQKHKQHTILLKELFPYHPKGLIYRNPNGEIACDQEALPYWERHKDSFLKGNACHLDIAGRDSGATNVNINSYEQNGTLYTVLSNSDGYTLQEAIKEGKIGASLAEIVFCVRAIVESLDVFHQNGFLHLDVSPDNVLLIPRQAADRELFRRIMLIDYNSVWRFSEVPEASDIYFSIKENYTAPEVRLQERSAVSPASDLFSVCAIFLELLQGKPLDYAGLYSAGLPAIDSLGILQRAPMTVTEKVCSILKKGLRLPPKQRYQTAEQLHRDLLELQNRIDGKGVTHASLWEASRRDFFAFMKRNPPYQYLLGEGLLPCTLQQQEGTSSSLQEAIRRYPRGFALTADGGMGKTTALLTLWRQGILKYQPEEPAFIYIPLYRYRKAGIPFLQKCILDGLIFDDTTATLDDALHVLNRLMDNKSNRGLPHITLLLDGLNEVVENRRFLIQEIQTLSEKEGVRLLLTSRSAEEDIQLPQLRIKPLDEAAIKAYLARFSVLYPSSQALCELIRNPMMLSLYTDTSKNNRQISNVSTPDELIGDYISSMITSFKARLDAGSDGYRLEYAAELLLPQLAFAMKCKRRNYLTAAELYREARKCEKLLRSKGFLKLFPQYLGRAGRIKDRAEDFDAWFDAMIQELLCRKAVFLVYDNQKRYRLTHDYFHRYFLGKYQLCRKRLKKLELQKWALGMGAAVLVFNLAAVGVQENVFQTLATQIEAIQSQNDFLIVDGELKAYLGKSDRVKIPDNVTCIGSTVFYKSNVTSVILPPKLTQIKEYAFSGCDRLSSITLPETLQEIGDYAFCDCLSLNKVSIPENVSSLGGNIFYGCTGLKEIFVSYRNRNYLSKDGVLYTGDEKTLLSYPAGKNETHFFVPLKVTAIASEAFAGNSFIASVFVHNGITDIREGAFSDMPNLTEIVVDESNGRYTSRDGILLDKDMKTLLCYPCGKTQRTLSVPATVTTIGALAFEKVMNIGEFTLPEGITQIRYGAFRNCRGMTSITLPQTLRRIEDYAFSECDSLASIRIPDTVGYIGESAFMFCSSLDSAALPGQLAQIPKSCFSNCSSLRTVVMPESLSSIGEESFLSCTTLEAVDLPQTLTVIAPNAFTACKSLQSVDIPEHVASIGSLAFMGCERLSRVVFYGMKTQFGENVFFNCGQASFSCPTGSDAQKYVLAMKKE